MFREIWRRRLAANFTDGGIAKQPYITFAVLSYSGSPCTHVFLVWFCQPHIHMSFPLCSSLPEKALCSPSHKPEKVRLLLLAYEAVTSRTTFAKSLAGAFADSLIQVRDFWLSLDGPRFGLLRGTTMFLSLILYEKSFAARLVFRKIHKLGWS